MPLSCFNCNATEELHSLPSPRMIKQWVDVIPNIQEKDFDENFRLCSAHFDPIYFTAQKRLYTNAIPSTFYVDGSWITIKTISPPGSPDIEKPELIKTDHFHITPDGDLNIVVPEANNKDNRIVRTSKKFRYISDIKTNILYSPKVYRQALVLCKMKIEDQRKEIRMLLNEIHQVKRDINIMNDLLDEVDNDTLVEFKHYYNIKGIN